MKTGVKHDFLRLLKIPTIQNPGKNWVKRFEDLKFDYIPSYLSHRMTNLVNLQTKHVCCFRITLKYHVIHIFVRKKFSYDLMMMMMIHTRRLMSRNWCEKRKIWVLMHPLYNIWLPEALFPVLPSLVVKKMNKNEIKFARYRPFPEIFK